MLRVAEQYSATDTGRQRRANEDALLARAPLFVVADGMGGARSGEVASRIAVESFQGGLDAQGARPEEGLAARALAANARIHELSQSDADHAGMGTTLTAVYVGEEEVSIAHVGDSRAYCLREGELQRLTDDHSLVDELIREGRLTPEEAEGHPQRSIITRALGPEAAVEIDTHSYRARAGDVYLLCSDGLTSMVPEARVVDVLVSNPRLRDAGEALISLANAAGGRDNITVVLLRLEEVGVSNGATIEVTQTAVEAPVKRDAAGRVRRPRVAPASEAPRRRGLARARGLLALGVVLGVLLAGAYAASQSVYFLGTNARGLVTVYRGLPYELPGGIALYSSEYVSGVSAATLAPARERTLLDHSLRSQEDARSLLRSLELGELSEG
ncbi:MAG TPA: Stp1/IreP family PP2C-type Ser/Thr phosphatase [Solirubrobacteraceae bacterium]|jgi:protein phosphatase|nr:Stp1/IreP family PP2C-type Ser/Thr phosphatase [Solirubrobacteraceae bacterium]